MIKVKVVCDKCKTEHEKESSDFIEIRCFSNRQETKTSNICKSKCLTEELKSLELNSKVKSVDIYY